MPEEGEGSERGNDVEAHPLSGRLSFGPEVHRTSDQRVEGLEEISEEADEQEVVDVVEETEKSEEEAAYDRGEEHDSEDSNFVCKRAEHILTSCGA